MPTPSGIRLGTSAPPAVPPILVAFYGRGGTGKSTTAALLKQHGYNPLAADFAFGLEAIIERFRLDTWPIAKPDPTTVQTAWNGGWKTRDQPLKTYVGKFAEYLRYMSSASCEHDVAILDGLDAAMKIAEQLVWEGTRGGLQVRSGIAQTALHPLLYDFFALRKLKVIILNEHRWTEERKRQTGDGENARETAYTFEGVQPDLFPRTREILHANADYLLHVDRATWTDDSGALRSRSVVFGSEIDTPERFREAKRRTVKVDDGMPLSQVWQNLGVIRVDKPKAEDAPS